MTRLVLEAFFGKPRGHGAAHAHENPPAMTIPLILLAVCAVLLGFLGTPWWPWLQRTLDPTFVSAPGGVGLMITSIVLVALGLGAGWAIYGRTLRTTATAADPLAVASPRLFQALATRLGFDELYAATVFRLNDALAQFADGLDRHVWDGLVRFLARFGLFTGSVTRETDEGVLNDGFNATSEKLRAGGQAYSRHQTGEAHGYLRVVAIGFVLIVLTVLLGGMR
jgi:NADH-quinone oxidoreductase subunit L